MAYPADSGVDELHPRTRATFAVFGVGTEQVEFPPETSTIRVRRGEPYRDINGLESIDTEMISLDLRGESELLGPVHLVGGSEQVDEPERRIAGKVVEYEPGNYFPAENWFDVFVEVRTNLGTFVNRRPERMSANIDRLPPSFTDTPYSSATEINLYPKAEVATLQAAPVGAILMVEHFA